MPKRVYQHIAGDVGVNAVRQVLPSAWIVREQSHDYGIDIEIEIADPSEALPGIIAKGQIKAISAKRKNRNLVRLDARSVEYWMNFAVPVFVFFAFHDGVYMVHVLEYVQDNLLSEKLADKETVAIRLDQAYRLPEATPKIENDARLFAEWVRQGIARLHFAFGARRVNSWLSAWMFGGDIDYAINWTRYFGSEDQVREDLPYLYWQKRELLRRGQSYKDLLSQELEDQTLEFERDEVWDAAVMRVQACIKRERSRAEKADKMREERGWRFGDPKIKRGN